MPTARPQVDRPIRRPATAPFTHAPIAAEASAAQATGRLLFIDNARWLMILLVLSMHAADTYSPFGNWYYVERPAVGPATQLFFLTYQTVLQGFFMALLFFVAGYFTPRSFDAKGPGKFLKGRLVRLGLPTLLYVALIGPVTEFYIAHSWHTTHSFAHEMGLYVVRARFLSGTGPMWFCAALLIITFGYAAWRRLRPAPSRPITIRATGVVLTIVGLWFATFAVRLVLPQGLTVFNMHPGDFPTYVTMFGLGVLLGRGNALSQVSDRFAGVTAAVCVGLAVLMWPAMLIAGRTLPGGAAAFDGGLHWQSAARCLWEALVCVGMSFSVLGLCRRVLATQGRMAKFMSDQAFAVYVVHPPVLIGIALLIAPAPLAAFPKFLLLWVLSLVACFGLAAPLARRAPFVGRIL